jgi:Skp family chaperone for outer membrane proteins
MRAGAAALALALAALPGLAWGQGTSSPPAAGAVRSPVLTLDADRLFAETRFGRRIAADLRARTEALAEENEALRRELTEEERGLADRRPTMEVEAFRDEADAFDARVQRIRAEQDAKETALEAAVQAARQEFLSSVTPVLAGLMAESGAAVILERRDVFLSANAVDVTDEAVAAIDAELGDGAGVPAPEAPEGPVPDAPETPPVPETPRPDDPAPG